jgi:hypothetical protein
MAVYPLLSDYSLGLEYILLDEALGSGVIEVTEVNDHGAVPNLKIYNKSPKRVLILDGEELVGAKQNRIVNTTVLIAAGATAVIIAWLWPGSLKKICHPFRNISRTSL